MYIRSSCSLLIGLLAAGASAQQTPSLARALPASTFACVQFAGLQQCRTAAEGLGLVRLGLGAFDQLGEGLRREIAQQLGQHLSELRRGLQKVGLRPAALRAVLARPMALGLGRPTFFGGVPMPSIALAIDVRGCEAAAQELLGVLEAALMHSGPDIQRTDREFGQVQATVLHPREHSGAVAFAQVGDVLVVTNSVGYLDECVQTLQGKRKSLGSRADHAHATARAGEGTLLSAWLDVAPFAAGIEPLCPYEVVALGAALGVTRLGSVSYSAAVRDGSSVAVGHVGVSGPRDGLLQALVGRPVSFDAVALCPPDTALFVTASLDPRAILAAGSRVVAALPREARRELDREVGRELRRELRHIDATPADLHAVLEAFGPEVTLAVTSPGGAALIPEIVALVDVVDEQRAQTVIQQLLSQAPDGVVAETQSKGVRICYTRALQREGIPVSPAFALHGGRLVIGSSVQAVKSVLARARGDREGLAGAADLAGHTAAARGAAVFGALRLRAVIPVLWRQVGPWIEKALSAQDAFDINPDILPTADQLDEIVRDSVWALRATDEGVTVHDQQMIGVGTAVAVLGMLADELLAGAPRFTAAAGASAGQPQPKAKIF